MQKECISCNKIKYLDDFSFRNKSKNIRHNKCKSCHKEYVKSHYIENTITYSTRAKLSNKNAILRNREWVFNYKKDKPCIDCGNIFHPCAMDFDHINKDKIDNISRMIGNSLSIDTIIDEIKKCELVCAVCHRIRTFNRNKVH